MLKYEIKYCRPQPTCSKRVRDFQVYAESNSIWQYTKHCADNIQIYDN